VKTLKGNIYTTQRCFRYGQIDIDKGLIVKVDYLEPDALTDDEKAVRIIPGLIDIHMHGAMGHDACNSDMDDLRAIAQYEKSQGVTSVCLASMTLDKGRLLDVCKKLGEASREIAAIKGIYLEGPFISEAKAGAQNPEHIQEADYTLYKELKDASDGMIKVVTVAPEKAGALELIKKVAAEKCVVSLAHSAANAREARLAFEAGATQVTHLYNAMNPMTHREPGIVGAAADCEKVNVELICDGVHVDPVMIRNSFRLFGADRIILISDSMEATGMPDGEYMLGDQKVTKNGNRATLGDSTIAGSVSNLYQCMLNAINYGISIEDAIATVTANPAKAIGIYDELGSIEVGKRADLLVTDDKMGLLEVIGGRTTCLTNIR